MSNVQVPPAVGSSGQFIDAVVITSSTLRQVIVLGDPASSGALAPVTSSAGQLVNISSGVITLSSAGITQVIPVTSSGINLYTTQGLNVVVMGSSGLSAPVTSSGGLSIHITDSGGPVTSSYGVLVQVSSGSLISLTSGTITLSSATSLSSGLVTLSSTPTVQNTSSGNVGIMPSTSVTLSIFNFNASSSASVQGVAAGAHTIYGWNFGSQVSGAQVCVHVYNTTAPTVGSTASLLFTIPIPGSTAGAGNNYTLPSPGVNSTGGIGFTLVDSFLTTSTALGTHSAGEVVGQLYYI